MARKIELSVILTTYERPEHLQRSLASLAMQRDVAGKFEVIVADDGSTDSTHAVVEQFAQTVNFPVKLTSHPHHDYRVALTRNDGARASSAPYLLFSDGDCIFPPDHLQKHLAARRPRVVRAGDCFRLDRPATERLDVAAITAQVYRRWVSPEQRRRMFQKWVKDTCYQWVGHRIRPKLTACNIGIWRSDLDAVNGFDETFVGWGCEDDDLAYRLREAGTKIVTVLGYTRAYHMWHPAHETRPAKWTYGANVQRLHRPGRPLRCRAGLVSVGDVRESVSSSEHEQASFDPQHYSEKAA
jgi:glycosyltransferase involved in cell wall biosynthesis